jgi:F0F1-type ATP synthase delta subunit
LGKIQRELFALDEFLGASKSASKLPYMSPPLNKILKQADINPLHAQDRQQLIQKLQFVRRTAPSVQISFASEPSQRALRILIRWFRENGHPNTLISVGVQPNLAGGCVIRTSTKQFDFSLQQLFKSNSQALAQRLI